MAGMSNICSRTLLHKIIRFKCQRKFILLKSLGTTTNDTSHSDTATKHTHFGFETVTEEEKYEKVYEVFHNVAEKYDVMNDAMSGGIHRLWKDYFVEQMKPMPGTQLLDVAGGTGDIAFRFLKYLENQQDTSIEPDLHLNIDVPMGDEQLDTETESPPHSRSTEDAGQKESHVTVCDINQAMLDVGIKRAAEVGYRRGITWLQGDAESLPVEDSACDIYSIAFGIRNVTHIDKVLSEAYRVLKPGGRFMCLEFSQVPNPIFRRLYDEYSFQVIPAMGQVIAGDWKSYQYLVESIRKFPNQDEFASMIREAGFRAVTYENLMLGISAIHSAFKL